MPIGSVQDPNEGFSRIAQVTVDDQGLIYVFEEADSEIRVYGPQGDRLRTIGRHGLGPGEFQGAVHLFGVQRETVWAIEFFAQSGARYKMTLFHRDGSHVESFVFPPVEARLTPAFALRQRPSRPKAR